MIRFITWKSILNRKVSAALCILSISLSVALFVGVERIRKGAEEGFTSTISQADLIVGAKGGPLQLLLYSVFNIGSAVNNIRYSSYLKIKSNPQVKWTIPISLGDSYRGHRVVGTNLDFFEHYRFRGDHQPEISEGHLFEGVYDVVLGSDVAPKFNLKLGSSMLLAHGVVKSAILKHEDSPFKVVGVLKKTSTPIDKAIYISLEGMEAMHIGWETGVPDKEAMAGKGEVKKEDIEINQITSFILATKFRPFLLRMRSWIDNFEEEPLMAVIPGLALRELWETIGYVEKILVFVSFCVLIVGLLGIVISLYTSINERRREMAIFRSLGASAYHILGLLVFESFLIVSFGVILGLAWLYSGMFMLRPILEAEFSIYLPIESLELSEWFILAGIILGGCIAGLLPALKSYRNSLQDGLTIKV